MNFNVLPTISFTPTSASFPFEPKQLSLPDKVRIQLQSQSTIPPSYSNGVFPRGSLTLSAPHAEVWIQGKQVLIRDRSSPYGTYVNGIRLQNQTLLQDGDIVTLGKRLSNSSAPSSALDLQLDPVEAFISIIGV